jgi:cellulose biosynthesis protein BcsQ
MVCRATITIEGNKMSNQERNKDALIAHIQALDTIIRQRNNRIAELNALLAGEEVKPVSEVVQKKIDKAYNKGWKDAYRAINQYINKNWDFIHLSTPPEGETK